MIEKLDNLIFEKLTAYTRQWVKNKKYKKHKFDLFIEFAGYETAYWAAEIIFSMVRIAWSHGPIWLNIIYIVFGSAVMIFQYIKTQDLKEQKEFYDQLWLQRKNPNVYNAVKEVTEEMFQSRKQWRQRQLAINLGLCGAMLLLNPLLTPVYGFMIVSQYYNYVFDFDEPEKKEKKATERLSDLLLGSWKNLIAGLNPASVGSGE